MKEEKITLRRVTMTRNVHRDILGLHPTLACKPKSHGMCPWSSIVPVENLKLEIVILYSP
jgi:hypothetical protein